MKVSILLTIITITAIFSRPLPKLTFLGESLCPDTIRFQTTVFAEFLRSPARSQLAASYEFVLYGNVKEIITPSGQTVLECQHGPNECRGNIIESCLFDNLEQDVASEILICVSNKIKEIGRDYITVEQALPFCYDGEAFNNIKQCYDGPRGKELEQENKAKTVSHDYIPFMILDGKHNSQIQQGMELNLVGYLCEYNDLVGKIPECSERINSGIDKPSITIYVESLCPYSIQFLEGSFTNFFKNPSRNVLASSVEVIFYGNAKPLPDSKEGDRKYQCQHGEVECIGNRYLEAGRELLSNEDYLLFTTKFANIVRYQPTRTADDMISVLKETSGENYEKIDNLVLSKGNELLFEASQLTGTHEYVPYILLNGVHSEDIQDKAQNDLAGFLCKYNKLVGKVEGCDIRNLRNHKSYGITFLDE